MVKQMCLVNNFLEMAVDKVKIYLDRKSVCRFE